MSDELSEWSPASSHSEGVGISWGERITPERERELRYYLDQWAQERDHGTRKGPFDVFRADVDELERLRLTGADVYWLAKRKRDYEPDDMPRLPLTGASFALDGPWLQGADLSRANLEYSDLEGAQLYRADLSNADFSKAMLMKADLSCANLSNATLTAADLTGANLEGANLRGARLNSNTVLNGVTLSHQTILGDIQWGGVGTVDLTQINWGAIHMLGDEYADLPPPSDNFAPALLPMLDPNLTSIPSPHLVGLSEEDVDGSLDSAYRIYDAWERARLAAEEQAKQSIERRARQAVIANHEARTRAYRQVAAQLRAQGISDVADRFIYRAQVCQRRLLRKQRKFGAYFFSLLLAALAGYGYRLERILIAYCLIVCLFAAGFVASDVLSGQATWTVPHALDALQISLNAIHGRVFFAQYHLDTVQSWLATAESIVGIVVEGVFVAMLIQRFFGR